MLKPGKINKLKVLRKTDIGYILYLDEDEVFLHANETNEIELEENMEVDAFLYFDQDQRLAATLHAPIISEGEIDFLEVVEVNDRFGVFLDMGINKDLLLSKDDLPHNKVEWPKEGDMILSGFEVIGSRFKALKQSKNDINPKEGAAYEMGDLVMGYIHRITSDGINMFSRDHIDIFIHHSMYKGEYRIGEEIIARITFVSDSGYSGSLLKQKEDAMLDDYDILLEYLNNHKEMPLTAKSPSVEIAKIFDMSRKAFKRALGKLYRERKVVFEDNKTILKE